MDPGTFQWFYSGQELKERDWADNIDPESSDTLESDQVCSYSMLEFKSRSNLVSTFRDVSELEWMLEANGLSVDVSKNPSSFVNTCQPL